MATQRHQMSKPDTTHYYTRFASGWATAACIKDGIPLHVDDFIPEGGLITADQFVEWVVLADNMTPSTSPHLKHIREAFVRHMGAEFVDATLLRVA